MGALDWIRAAYELEMSPEVSGGINHIATEIHRIIDNGPYPNMNNAILQHIHPGGFAPTAQAVRDVVHSMLEQMLRD